MADVSVRPARAGDAAAVADLQVRTWQEAYADALPPAALAALHESDAEARWRDAITAPPSPRHHVLVAVDAGRLAGFVACGPAGDPDLDPDRDAEVVALVVATDHQRRGHGSRMLAAAVDVLRADGTSTAVVWLFDADAATQAFYESAGWGRDGAARELDMGEPVRQVRLHTALG